MRTFKYTRNVAQSADISGLPVTFASRTRIYELDPSDPIVSNMIAEGWLVEVPPVKITKKAPSTSARSQNSPRNKNSKP